LTQIHFPILWLATVAAGGIIAGTNPLLSSFELTHHFKITTPRYVFVQSECLQAVEEAISACNISLKALFILCGPHQTVPQGYQPWQTLLEHGECDWETGTVYYKSVGEKLAAFKSTSGTTGLPKAAAVSHRFVVAQTSLIEQRFKNKPYQVHSPLTCHLSIVLTHSTAVSTRLSTCLPRVCGTNRPCAAPPPGNYDLPATSI
jgi:long-subunit acyl-CoA synthetase (AMP-forming)